MSSSLLPRVFYTICKHFFAEDGTKLRFNLTTKSTVVSDPFVEYLDENVFSNIKPISGRVVQSIVAPSHLSPDLAFYEEKKTKKSKIPNELFGIEVKTSKSKSGDINFNSTPPCGKVVVDVNGEEKIIPCYYFFVQLTPLEEDEEDNMFEIGTMMLVDGDFINSDFDLYLEATGVREKRIDLGSYGDGMDRQRPMFVFPNPLGIAGIRSERSTMISKDRFKTVDYEDEIGMVATVNRDGQEFFAYQAVRKLTGPFVNVTRSTSTKSRNKLKVTT